MSVSVTGNDLGSMGAPSSDTALAPLIAALTSNTKALDSSTTKLTVFETALDKLQTVFANIAALSTGISALRVGVERLTASLSSQSMKGAKSSTGTGAKDNLEKLEEKWLKREYEDRKKYQNKKQKKEEYIKTQYQPTQESHVDAFKANEAAQAKIASEKDDAAKGAAAAKQWREGLDKIYNMQMQAFEESLAAQEAEIVKAAAEEASARAKWREGLDKIEAIKMEAAQAELQAAQNALAKEASKLGAEYGGRPSTQAVEEQATLRQEIEAIEKESKSRAEAVAEAMKEAQDAAIAMGEQLNAVIASDKELHRTDRGGPSKPGGGGGTSPGGMGSFSGSPVAQAGMALFSAINMAISGFNKLHSAVESLAKSAMTYAPGIAIAMERALKDLDAVVGSYSAQVGASMIPLVRTIADYMFPAMLALGNAVSLVVQSLIPFATAIMQAVMPVVTLVANTFSLLWKAMSPLIDFLGAIFSFIGIIIGAFAGVLQGNIDLLSDVFSYIQPLFSLFANTVSQAIEMFRQLVITITSWIPYVGAAVKKALTPQSTEGLAAASTAKYGNAQSLGEAAAQNAFIATSGQLTPEEEFAQQMMDNDIPNKWAMALDAQGRPMDIAVRKDDGWVGEGGGGNWNDAPQGKPLHGRNNAPIRMGM
jgi:chemotaxis protein histidine kinase CheA